MAAVTANFRATRITARQAATSASKRPSKVWGEILLKLVFKTNNFSAFTLFLWACIFISGKKVQKSVPNLPLAFPDGKAIPNVLGYDEEPHAHKNIK
ncbi:hypothetical protein PoB_002590100 [Plakobranchus ocellatus]|uniref:Uncharacterized protein n=1 Tax=Plakobranchus ocellatus TaxID=259542 RepID=A0AAV3ZJX1_9GAST|nr:hypothetical protein PoB_002590100 [Plakobranchus ocellatus]